MLPAHLVKIRNQLYLIFPIFHFLMFIKPALGVDSFIFSLAHEHLFSALVVSSPLLILYLILLYLIFKFWRGVRHYKIPMKVWFMQDELEKRDFRTAYNLSYVIFIFVVLGLQFTVWLGAFKETYLNFLTGLVGLPFFLFALMERHHDKAG